MEPRHSAEQIVAERRQADIEMGKGLKVPEVFKHLGISEQTCYRLADEVWWNGPANGPLHEGR